MVLTQQLFCVRDLSSKGKSTRRANSGIPRAPHTLEATVFFLPLAKRFWKGRSALPPRALSAPRTATGIASSFFFRTRCPHYSAGFG